MSIGKPKVIAIIQARMGSSRLPGKTLMLMNGKPMLEHLLENIKKSKYIKEFIVATSKKDEDSKIEKFCNKLNIKCFRGEEYDVLSRFKFIVDIYKPDLVVRLTGDNPFVDSMLLDFMLDKYFYDFPNYDYINNIDLSFPYGLYAEVFTSRILKLAVEKSSYKDLEHVTMYIRRNEKKFKTATVKSDQKFKYERLTVDNEEDFLFAENLFKQYKIRNRLFSLNDLIV